MTQTLRDRHRQHDMVRHRHIIPERNAECAGGSSARWASPHVLRSYSSLHTVIPSGLDRLKMQRLPPRLMAGAACSARREAGVSECMSASSVLSAARATWLGLELGLGLGLGFGSGSGSGL